MPMIRPFVWLTVLAAAAGLASPVSAQYFQPFVDPQYFETPDLQFFAPAEVGEFSGPEPANTGPYFVYERLNFNMTRPRGEPSLFSDTNGDFTWGNRYELGYMTEDKTGWQAVVWNLHGPNAQLITGQLQNFITEIANPQVALDQQSVFSLNTAVMMSIELNKVWRRKEFHDHSVLDLLLGVRYISYNDFYRREFMGQLPGTGADNWFVTYNNTYAKFENMMYGGQFGGRYFNQRGHWLLSAEARMFALANNQMLTNGTEQIILDADPIDTPLIDTPGVDVARQETNSHAAQFCWGGEVRLEAAYELTRDISIRVGGMFMDLGKGVGRGPLLRNNDQDVQIAGVSFGFTVNR